MRLASISLAAIVSTATLAVTARAQDVPLAAVKKSEAISEEDPKLPHAGDSIPIALPEKREGASLLWKPRWRKFSNVEYAITGVAIVLTLGSLAIPNRGNVWKRQGIIFDEGARGVLKADGSFRVNARDTSDVLLSISSSYPMLIDALVVAWWHRGSSIVATQMALMNAEAMAVTAAIQGLVSAVGSRERPYGRPGGICDDGVHSTTSDCVHDNRYRSFFSGHTSQAFVSAALTCAHHANIPLYGSRTADQLACVTHLALAGAIGTLRIVADMHYASDVITGAVIGSTVGLAIPYLWHYKPAEETARVSPWAGVRLLPMPNGLAVTGFFG
jgi:membrane-associated phospholipid phosphatase